MLKLVLLLCAVAALFGQDQALVRLKAESARLKASQQEKIADDHIAAAAALHLALRDWIESRLPNDKGALSVKFGYLEADMQRELREAGLNVPETAASLDPFDGPGFGYTAIRFTRFPELPNSLFVTASLSVPCGDDEAVYMYNFDALSRKRVLEDHSKSEWGYASTQLDLSEPDGQGRRLLLIHRLSTQCASTWMGMTYSVYRLGYLQGVPEDLLSADHGFWLGNDGPEFVLKPEEVIVEFLDRSVDAAVHNRTQIHRYTFAHGVRRLDPVALQPQDFAEEWLTQPWSEMQSASAPKTQAWHARLHNDEYVAGEYSEVVPCMTNPGRWLIALDIEHLGDRELPKPLTTYLVVRELGNYRYEMEDVSESRPQACPGSRFASDKHPWLSADELKALR